MPLVIEYGNNTTAWVQHDEENISTGLQQHGRIRRLVLQGPSPSLRTCLVELNEHFPQLEYLSITSTTKEEASLVLPGTFRAPNLRHLAFHDVGLPGQLSLSASATALVTLTLTHIPALFYFHPGHLITQLRELPYLEELSIGFAVPMPRPSSEGKLLPMPISRVTLPILKRFTFRGVVVYLENLVAQIYTPLLEQLNITLLFQLAFTLVNLTQFIPTIERLRCLSASVLFERNRASIVTSNGDSRDGGGLTISIICMSLDWQIDATTQVCGALAQVLSSIEELTLDLEDDMEEAGIPFDRENALDGTLWRELLLQFRGVRRLHIDSALTSELSDALTSDAAGLDLELLPDLQDLEVQLEFDHAHNAFSTFIETRECAGRLVRLLASSIPKARSKMLSTQAATTPTYKAFLIGINRTFSRVSDERTTVRHLLPQTALPDVSSLAVPSTSLGMPFRGQTGRGSDELHRSKGPRGSRRHNFPRRIAQSRKVRIGRSAELERVLTDRRKGLL